jgi:hypothetical protein
VPLVGHGVPNGWQGLGGLDVAQAQDVFNGGGPSAVGRSNGNFIAPRFVARSGQFEPTYIVGPELLDHRDQWPESHLGR